MPLTFAVPDLHGRYDLLQAALAAIDDRAASGTVVFLGDYVDRGPASADILERLMAGPPDGWRWVCLKGNHEAMMTLALRNPDRLDWWVENGGAATIDSYEGRHERVAGHLPWIEALPTIHVDAHRVFVHAGVDCAVPLDQQSDKTLLWKRYPCDMAEGHAGRHVVHGHHPDPDGPLCLAGRSALDCMAWRTGRLAVGVFDDDKAGSPVQVLDVRAGPGGLAPRDHDRQALNVGDQRAGSAVRP